MDSRGTWDSQDARRLMEHLTAPQLHSQPQGAEARFAPAGRIHSHAAEAVAWRSLVSQSTVNRRPTQCWECNVASDLVGSAIMRSFPELLCNPYGLGLPGIMRSFGAGEDKTAESQESLSPKVCEASMPQASSGPQPQKLECGLVGCSGQGSFKKARSQGPQSFQRRFQKLLGSTTETMETASSGLLKYLSRAAPAALVSFEGSVSLGWSPNT